MILSQIQNLIFGSFLLNDDGELLCRVYDKRDEFNFDRVNLSFMDINIPIDPDYGVYVLWLIDFAIMCTDFHDFSKRHTFFVFKLRKHSFSKIKL